MALYGEEAWGIRSAIKENPEPKLRRENINWKDKWARNKNFPKV